VVFEIKRANTKKMPIAERLRILAQKNNPVKKLNSSHESQSQSKSSGEPCHGSHSSSSSSEHEHPIDSPSVIGKPTIKKIQESISPPKKQQATNKLLAIHAVNSSV
jgi:hypothetical protein